MEKEGKHRKKGKKGGKKLTEGNRVEKDRKRGKKY